VDQNHTVAFTLLDELVEAVALPPVVLAEHSPGEAQTLCLSNELFWGQGAVNASFACMHVQV
jgi:hypothetical protein